MTERLCAQNSRADELFQQQRFRTCRDTDLTSEQRGFLETVRSSAHCLLRILNDILDFSKIEAGYLELDPIDSLADSTFRNVSSQERSAKTQSDKNCFDRESALRRAICDFDSLVELAGMCVDDYESLLPHIVAAIADGDAEQLGATAHTLKGSVASMCAQLATCSAQRLETLGGDGELTEADDAYAALESEVVRLICELKDLSMVDSEKQLVAECV